MIYNLPDAPYIREAEKFGMEELAAVYICRSCGGSITEGEVYVEFMDNHYHLNCAREEALSLLIDECGVVSSIAEVSRLC